MDFELFSSGSSSSHTEEPYKLEFLYNLGLIPKSVAQKILLQTEEATKHIQTRSKRRWCAESVSNISKQFDAQIADSQSMRAELNITSTNLNNHMPADDLSLEIPPAKKAKVQSSPLDLSTKKKAEHDQQFAGEILNMNHAPQPFCNYIDSIDNFSYTECCVKQEEFDMKPSLYGENIFGMRPVRQELTAQQVRRNEIKKISDEISFISKLLKERKAEFEKAKLTTEITKTNCGNTSEQMCYTTENSFLNVIVENEHQAIELGEVIQRDVTIEKVNTTEVIPEVNLPQHDLEKSQNDATDNCQIAGPSEMTPIINLSTDQSTIMNTQLEVNSSVLKELQNLTPSKESPIEKPKPNETTSKEPSSNSTTLETSELIVEQRVNVESTENLLPHVTPERRVINARANDEKKVVEMKSFKDFKNSVTPEELAAEMASYNPNMARKFRNVEQTDARKKNTYASRLCRARVRIAKRKMEEHIKSCLKKSFK